MFFNPLFLLFLALSTVVAQFTVTVTDKSTIPPLVTAQNQGPVGAPPPTSGIPHQPVPYVYTTVINGVTNRVTDIFTPTDIRTTPTSIPATGTILDLPDFLSLYNHTTIGSSSPSTSLPPVLLFFTLTVLPAFIAAGRSWAEEMDNLPSAPAARNEDAPNDRYSRRGDDFLSSRPDRGPPREDVPLPTQPPYTAFIGNLAFDLTESELEGFFSDSKIKTVKLIRDRDEKPKGFGYIEFEDLQGLKDAIAKSGSSFSGRTIRVSVAEPPKERSGFGGSSHEDNAKFDNPWRREGRLPDLPEGQPARRRYDSERGERAPPPPSISEGVDDWRSSRVPRAPPPPENEPSFKRKGSGFFAGAEPGAADKEDTWAIGGKFKATAPSDEPPSRFGSLRGGRSDMGPPKEPAAADEGDWRSAARGPKSASRTSRISTPPTPQLARRKLELLPRSGNASSSPSPLSSPKMAHTPPVSGGASRSNPFGAARPVDVTNREKEVEDRLERERGAVQEKLSMSRTSSRTGVDRGGPARPQTPPVSGGAPPKVQATRPAASLAPSSYFELYMRQFNVVVLGAGGVGKSALTVRFIKDVFVENYDPTIEEEYRRTITVDGKLDSLEVLDTAGAEQFTSLNEVYIKSGRGFVLVFSLTQEASLQEVDNLRKQILRIKGGSTNVPIVIVGTKLDLVNEREVQRATIQSLSAKWELPFYETSAKRNWHVSEVFEDLLRQMRLQFPQDPAKKRKKRHSTGCVLM
ncbi:hypothetical protein CVT24_010318 [Panaeolus cyanescens]|uniref:RRM domain-containing protein n=1 Tax=Panaeolus cyanescens TaxID=181874 RepID=A0A409VE84_9AGAR|nr:hypothetical protein CVT24_010318 [Panaeolus cyanescens]